MADKLELQSNPQFNCSRLLRARIERMKTAIGTPGCDWFNEEISLLKTRHNCLVAAGL